jgi:hypothetical protein
MIFTSPDIRQFVLPMRHIVPLTLAHAYQRQEYEHESFDKDCCESEIVGDDAVAMESDDLVSKVCIQSHARSQSDRHICEKAEYERREARNSCRGGNERAVEI